MRVAWDVRSVMARDKGGGAHVHTSIVRRYLPEKLVSACLLQRYSCACLTIRRRVRVVGCVIRLSRDAHHQGTKLPNMGPFGMKVSRSFGRPWLM